MSSLIKENRLVPVQSLHTSCARAVAPFQWNGKLYLAIPQMTETKPGEEPYMNGGNSDIPMLIYQWTGAQFELWQELAVPGGEDAEIFRIGSRLFLAAASIRTGSGPYEYNVQSTVFEWKDDRFQSFQQFPTFAAKQWRSFVIGERHFLALAQGVVQPALQATNPAESMIFEWNGHSFEHFQTVPSAWGYNWEHFVMHETHFLAYADHQMPSIIMRWTGDRFELVQTLEGKSGRAFSFFQREGASYLAFANLQGDSVLYRWDDGEFAQHQVLGGPGGREFTTFLHDNEFYLVMVNFLTGSPKLPKTDLDSILFRFENDRLVPLESFPTLGATGAATFEIDGQRMIAISESLTADVRFTAESHVYRLN